MQLHTCTSALCICMIVDMLVHLKLKFKIVRLYINLQISVSCGIPDFRSANGVYARLAVEYPDLPDPQAMFDISYFKDDPRPFFNFAKVCTCSTHMYYVFVVTISL